MCSQETPNVNNPNIEGKDLLLPKGVQKKIKNKNKNKKTYRMLHASVQLSNSTNELFPPSNVLENRPENAVVH